jgi:hypothetical protein
LVVAGASVVEAPADPVVEGKDALGVGGVTFGGGVVPPQDAASRHAMREVSASGMCDARKGFRIGMSRLLDFMVRDPLVEPVESGQSIRSVGSNAIIVPPIKRYSSIT